MHYPHPAIPHLSRGAGGSAHGNERFQNTATLPPASRLTLNFRSNCSITCLLLIWLLILILVSDPKAGVKIDVWEQEQPQHGLSLRHTSLGTAPCPSGDKAKPKISYLVVVEVAIAREPVSFYFCPGDGGELGPPAHGRGIAAAAGQGGTVELLLPPGPESVTVIAWMTCTEESHTSCAAASTPEEGGSQ